MKILNYKMITSILLIALSAISSYAEATVKIRNITVDDNVYTPYYQIDTEQDHDQGASQRWLRLTVEYKTTGDWIDELTVQHFALVGHHGSDKPVILSGTTTYINIAPGNHVAYVYMHPSCVKRYDIDSSNVDSSAAIIINGKQVEYKEINKYIGKKGWSKDSSLDVYSGHLLSENETPFWFVNYDYKEMIKHNPHDEHQ